MDTDKRSQYKLPHVSRKDFHLLTFPDDIQGRDRTNWQMKFRERLKLDVSMPSWRKWHFKNIYVSRKSPSLINDLIKGDYGDIKFISNDMPVRPSVPRHRNFIVKGFPNHLDTTELYDIFGDNADNIQIFYRMKYRGKETNSIKMVWKSHSENPPSSLPLYGDVEIGQSPMLTISEMIDKPIKCYSCDEVGHISRHCPAMDRENSNANQHSTNPRNECSCENKWFHKCGQNIPKDASETTDNDSTSTHNNNNYDNEVTKNLKEIRERETKEGERDEHRGKEEEREEARDIELDEKNNQIKKLEEQIEIIREELMQKYENIERIVSRKFALLFEKLQINEVEKEGKENQLVGEVEIKSKPPTTVPVTNKEKQEQEKQKDEAISETEEDLVNKSNQQNYDCSDNNREKREGEKGEEEDVDGGEKEKEPTPKAGSELEHLHDEIIASPAKLRSAGGKKSQPSISSV